jgi:hypothetical protein
MRQIRMWIVSVGVIVSLAAVWASTAAGSAQIVNGHASGTLCVAASNASGGPFLITSDMIALGSPGGVYLLTCQFTYPAGFFPSSQFRVTGFPCVAWMNPFLITYDSFFVGTPGGRGTLVCRLHA